jgi:hypothetical protein
MKSAYRVPRGLFGASGFDSQDSESSSPITSIRVNSLVISPAPGASLPRGGAASLFGYAWDGGSGIRELAASLDSGKTWRPARLMNDLGRYAWVQWKLDLAPSRTGPFTVRIRALARDGSTQPDALVQNPAGYHHNVAQEVHYFAA